MTAGSTESVDDVFHTHQLRVLKWFLVTVSLLLIPFDVNHFIQGRHVLAIALAVTVILFLLSAGSIHFRRQPLFPHVVVFLPIAGTLWLAISNQGISAVFWVYPTVLLAHYTLPRLQANLVALVLTIMATSLSYFRIAPEIALRVGATLFVTVVFANIFLGMISRLASQMGELAMLDPLTGAFNRRQLDSCLRKQQEARRRYGTPMSLLLMDIDHFKAINDRFGHEVGDQVLQEIVRRVRTSLRSMDLLFRVGGEEFAVLLPTKLEGAQQVAEKIRMIIQEMPVLGEVHVTVSIGVGELGEREQSRDLFRRCDDALYQAKAGGRNMVLTSTGADAPISLASPLGSV